MGKKISVIGLGWLGLPLAKKIIEKGVDVKGSTTSIDKLQLLLKEGMDVYKVFMTENSIEGDIIKCLEGSETLILNTPPGLRKNPISNYVSKIEKLIPYIERSTIKNVLYVSSTSVFADAENFPIILNNTSPNAVSNTGKQIMIVEDMLRQNEKFKTTILRFSGLVDERRHPVTMISKRKIVANPNAPVNLIHLDDCIGVILKIIELQKWGFTLNASYPLHPSKNEYYTSQALAKSLTEPNFDFARKSSGKIINGNETANFLNYTYNYTII